jgi:hypothetical protein
MVISSAAPATAVACLLAALRGDVVVARAWFGLGGLVLAVLVRLFARTEPAWPLSPNDLDGTLPRSRGIVMPAIGRAPHAACIEAGLVPDWILPGIRNRGMRPAAVPLRLRRRVRPARAPPGIPQPPRRNPPPTEGRRLTPTEVL